MLTTERIAYLRLSNDGPIQECLDEIERLRSAIVHATTAHCGAPDKCEYWGSSEICDYLCNAIGYKDPEATYDEC